jgi:hypothetical protein
MAKTKRKASANKKANPWLVHLKKYKKEHPNKSFTDCMSEAKKTYKK